MMHLDDLDEVAQNLSDLNIRDAWRRDFYPLDSFAMPPPGPDFVKHAKDLAGDDEDEFKEILNELYLRALHILGFTIPLASKLRKHVSIIPGHIWHDGVIAGPERGMNPRVMVVGKMAGPEEALRGRNLCGASAAYLRSKLEELGISESEYGSWYVANIVRWSFTLKQALPVAWVKDCLPLLTEELRILRPRFILCLGAEAIKYICGPKHSVNSLLGRALDIDIPINKDESYVATVIGLIHPASVLRSPASESIFMANLQLAAKLISGRHATPNDRIGFTVHTNEESLRSVVDSISALGKTDISIAVDLEWEGHYASEPGSYIRTVQFAFDPSEAHVVKLHNDDGTIAFNPGIDAAASQLKRLLYDPIYDTQGNPIRRRIVGSFFAYDLPWLKKLGIDLTQSFAYPEGFDVALAMHALNEATSYDLETMACRLLGVPRWSTDLDEWKKAFCKKERITESELPGYGKCPDDILIPYGAYDAVYTLRLANALDDMLHRDPTGASSTLNAFQTAMMALPAFSEMSDCGICFDVPRAVHLAGIYENVKNAKISELRKALNWPGFNPRSSQQCVAMLFGDRYASKRDNEGRLVAVRPKGAITLDLRPIKSTDDKPWEDCLLDSGCQPSTDRETCNILAAQHPLVKQLADIRLLDQVTKTILRIPEEGAKFGSGGLISFVGHDGRVRSHYSQLKETGRASSSRPPLQNIAKRRESDYVTILGDKYEYPIRSCFRSDIANNKYLIEADFVAAELLVMAVLARDELLIEHCKRAALPESHPDHFDIHSNIAVKAFKLNCAPTKHDLARIGKIHLRTAAKNIIYGLGYGRTIQACARQIQSEGVNVSETEVAAVYDTIYSTYRNIEALQNSLRDRVTNPGWIATYFGRKRRAFPTNDPAMLAQQEREFMNFPMQSLVADAMHLALGFLYYHPSREYLKYSIVLQLHDAVLLEVPADSVAEVYHEILPECMTKNVTFKSCDLSGKPYPDSGTYSFDIDRSVYVYWGEKLSDDVLESLGVLEK